MLQTIGPNMDPSISMMILADIALLKRMPELAHKLKTWKPTPDPMAEQMKQLELQNQQLENQKLQSEIAKNYALAEQAKANSDKTNLDFVEQETGTAHARDMEKQKAQSQGNQNLEITKALLNPRKQANGSESKPDIPAALGFNQVSDILNNAGQPPASTNSIPVNRDGVPAPLSIGSKFYDPRLDPALNPNLNI